MSLAQLRSCGARATLARWEAATLHVALPVIVGAAIYLLFRTRTLLAYQWVTAAGAGAWLEVARDHAMPFRAVLSGPILYTVPDAMWVYGLTACMRLIWSRNASGARWVWVSLGVVLGAGGELGQALGIVPGTFDPADLIACFAAAILAVHFTRISS